VRERKEKISGGTGRSSSKEIRHSRQNFRDQEEMLDQGLCLSASYGLNWAARRRSKSAFEMAEACSRPDQGYIQRGVGD